MAGTTEQPAQGSAIPSTSRSFQGSFAEASGGSPLAKLQGSACPHEMMCNSLVNHSLDRDFQTCASHQRDLHSPVQLSQRIASQEAVHLRRAACSRA